MVKLVFGFNLLPGKDPNEFERWFKEIHLPDLKKIPGVRKIVVNKAVEAPLSEPLFGVTQTGLRYYRLGELHFDGFNSLRIAELWWEANLLPPDRGPFQWISRDPGSYFELIAVGDEFVPALTKAEDVVRRVFAYKLLPGRDPSEFEKYLFRVHIPDILASPGVRRIVANKVVGALKGEPQYYRTGEVHYDSIHAYGKSFAWRQANPVGPERDARRWIDFSPKAFFACLCFGEEIEV